MSKNKMIKKGKGTVIAIIAGIITVFAGTLCGCGTEQTQDAGAQSVVEANQDIMPEATAKPETTEESVATGEMVAADQAVEPEPTPEAPQFVNNNLLENEAGLALLEKMKGLWFTVKDKTDSDLKQELRMPEYLSIDDELIQNDGMLSSFHRKNKNAKYVVDNGTEYIVFRGYLDATYSNAYYKVDMRICLLPDGVMEYDIRKDGEDWQYFGSLVDENTYSQYQVEEDIQELIEGYDRIIGYAADEYGSWEGFLAAIDTDFGGNRAAAFRHISYEREMDNILTEWGCSSLDEAVDKGIILEEDRVLYELLESMFECYGNHMDAITAYAQAGTVDNDDMKALYDEIYQNSLKYDLY